MKLHWNPEHIFHLLQFQLTLDATTGPLQEWIRQEPIALSIKGMLRECAAYPSFEEAEDAVRRWLLEQRKASGPGRSMESLWDYLQPLLEQETEGLTLPPLPSEEEGLLEDGPTPLLHTGTVKQVSSLTDWGGDTNTAKAEKKVFEWNVESGQFDAWEGVLGGATPGSTSNSALPPKLSELEHTDDEGFSVLAAPITSPLLDEDEEELSSFVTPLPRLQPDSPEGLLDAASTSPLFVADAEPLSHQQPPPSSNLDDVVLGASLLDGGASLEPGPLLPSSPLSTMVNLPQASASPDELAPSESLEPLEPLGPLESFASSELPASSAPPDDVSSSVLGQLFDESKPVLPSPPQASGLPFDPKDIMSAFDVSTTEPPIDPFATPLPNRVKPSQTRNFRVISSPLEHTSEALRPVDPASLIDEGTPLPLAPMGHADTPQPAPIKPLAPLDIPDVFEDGPVFVVDAPEDKPSDTQFELDAAFEAAFSLDDDEEDGALPVPQAPTTPVPSNPLPPGPFGLEMSDAIFPTGGPFSLEAKASERAEAPEQAEAIPSPFSVPLSLRSESSSSLGEKDKEPPPTPAAPKSPPPPLKTPETPPQDGAVGRSGSNLDIIMGVSVAVEEASPSSVPLMKSEERPPRLFPERPSSMYIRGPDDSLPSDEVIKKAEPELRYVPIRMDDQGGVLPLSKELSDVFDAPPQQSSPAFKLALIGGVIIGLVGLAFLIHSFL